ncbi:hypothetical protein [Sphingomonas sp. ERG5]|uniref:hypothetical protein n=1 Tax=Sphingomonas sp. ERG5 TaxID=1381597 RepID=UPI001269BBDB|nr:hypothetical protein [Sphingomonas sp. ERG5]
MLPLLGAHRQYAGFRELTGWIYESCCGGGASFLGNRTTPSFWQCFGTAIVLESLILLFAGSMVYASVTEEIDQGSDSLLALFCARAARPGVGLVGLPERAMLMPASTGGNEITNLLQRGATLTSASSLLASLHVSRK